MRPGLRNPAGCLVKQRAGLVPDVLDLVSGGIGKSAVRPAGFINEVSRPAPGLVRQSPEAVAALVGKMAVSLTEPILHGLGPPHGTGDPGEGILLPLRPRS